MSDLKGKTDQDPQKIQSIVDESDSLKKKLGDSYHFNTNDNILDEFVQEEIITDQSTANRILYDWETKPNLSFDKDAHSSQLPKSEGAQKQIEAKEESLSNKDTSDMLLDEKHGDSPNKDTFRELKNPIDFVHHIEMEYPKQKIDSQKTKQIQIREKPKYDEIQSESLSAISELITSKKIQVNVMKVKGDWLLAGDAFGKIYAYSISKGKEEKVLYDKDLKESCVNCIDITHDEEYILSAYSSGLIALWEVKSFKCKKVMEKLHEGAVIAIKIYNKIKKGFEFLSSDFEGNVHKSIVKDRLVTHSVTSVPFIIKNKNIVYIIDMFDFTQQEIALFPSLCRFNQTVIIGCLSQIKLIAIEPEIEEVFSFDKPDEFEDYEVSDVGYGLGYAPCTSDDSGNKDTLLLLAISWGKIVYLFKIIVTNGSVTNVVQIGYFINTSTILRLSFLAHSVILIADSEKFFRAVSTVDFCIGSKVNRFREPIIKGGRLIDSEIQYQTLFQDKNLKWKCTYNNLIVLNANSAYFLGKKNIFKLSLLNWEKCIETILSDSNKLLIASTDMYYGRQGALADIPQDERQRKEAIKSFLERKLKEYLETTLLVRSDLLQSQMETYLNNIIELCIEIGMIDFLLNKVESSFSSYKEQFLKKLESFILCDKLLRFELTIPNVITIINLYATNQQSHLLEQLLIHFNISAIDSEEIKSKCEEYHLIDPLIYIHMNGKEKNYFEPIAKIYAIFVAKSPSQSPFDQLVKNKKLFEIIVSKEYIGYKLFWYINWCLKGLIFPTEKRMTETEYHEVIFLILPWLLGETVFANLIQFDPKCLFATLKLIFGNSTIHTFLDQADNKQGMKEAVLKRIKDEADLSTNDSLSIALIRLIERRMSLFNDKQECLACYHEFVAKASSFYSLDHDPVYETIAYLLTSEDQRTKTEAEITEISNDIMSMIDKQNILRDNDYYYLQLKADKSLYAQVKIKLYEKDYNYNQCLDIFLQENNNIPNRTVVFFKWIDETLTTLSNGDKTTFSIFKNEVLNYLFKIGALSIDSMCNMMAKWYSQNSELVLDKLNSAPEVKLQYVEHIIESFKDKEEESLDEEENKMLILQIELLCQLKRGERILSLLENNSFYPMKPCLELCISHNIDDATIFLYQSTGAPSLALNICMTRLNDIYRQISNNLNSAEYNPKAHEELHKLFMRYKDDCLAVCKKNGVAHDDLWFEFLDKLYELNEAMKGEIKNKTKVINHWITFRSHLSKIIKDIFETMTNYVSIIKVIEKLTKNRTAEFKEMKDSLVQIIGDYSHQLNILDSAKCLLSGSVIKHKDEFLRLNLKGNEYSLDKCDLCQASFNETKNETEILTFFCGHKAHRFCNSQSNQGNACLICQSQEIDAPINTLEIKKPSTLITDHSVPKKLSQAFKKKMEIYDKNIQERMKMVIEESVKLFE